MKCNKEQICEILGIAKRTLINMETNKKIEKLEERLDRKGYKLLGKEKKGRNVYYNLELVNPEKEVYSNIVKHSFGSDEEEKVATYFLFRTKENTPIGKKDIANSCGLSTSTVAKLDKEMIKLNIVEEDGYYYFSLEEGIPRQCTHAEYKKYWSNIYSITSYKTLHKMFEDGEITLNELKLAIEGKKELQKQTDAKYCYRMKKYKTNKENELYITISNCIKEIYKEEK